MIEHHGRMKMCIRKTIIIIVDIDMIVELEEEFEVVKSCTGKKYNNPMTWVANAVENDEWYKVKRDEVTRTMMSMIDQKSKVPALDANITNCDASLD